MKKIILLFVLAFSLMAGYVEELKSYLLSKEFQINGAFFLVEKSGKWVYAAMDNKGKVVGYYELMGTKPSPSNPFGWRALSHAVPIMDSQMMGYFVYIGFGPDILDPARKAYSWVFIDAKTGAIYKLMGQKRGYFEYLQEDGKTVPLKGIFFHKEGNKALFYSCMDSFEDSNFSIRKFSKQSGSIAYECSVGLQNPYHLLAPIEPKSIEIKDQIVGRVAFDRVELNVTRKPLEGTVHIQGVVGEKEVDCLRKHKPLSSQKIRNDWQLRFVADWDKEAAILKEQGSCVGVDELLANPLFLGFKRSLTIQETNSSDSLVFWKDISKF